VGLNGRVMRQNALSACDTVRPIGIKGIAEIGGVSAAIANAVYHATGQRIRLHRSPLSGRRAPGLQCPWWQVTGMSLSYQITVG
jgi:hypothetical protein